MEVVELLLMAPVDCPGLAAVKEGGKDNSAVHLDLGGDLDSTPLLSTPHFL